MRSGDVNQNKGNRMKKEILLQDLSEQKRKHLAWRLDNKTWCGYVSACKIARLDIPEMNTLPVWKIFELAGKSTRSAKIHAKKVIDFTISY